MRWNNPPREKKKAIEARERRTDGKLRIADKCDELGKILQRKSMKIDENRTNVHSGHVLIWSVAICWWCG